MELEFTIPKKRFFKNVYQLKINLLDTKVWRRILVPESYTFYDLHLAIQDSVGWTDSHLHRFEKRDENSHRPTLIIDCPYCVGEYENEAPTFYVTETSLSRFFKHPADYIYYEYDFGDSWHHKIELEDILPKISVLHYPLCLSGQMACPPEDCGSIPGYLDCIKASKGKGRKELREWLDPDWDPKYFDPKKVKFQNPRKRFLETMEN